MEFEYSPNILSRNCSYQTEECGWNKTEGARNRNTSPKRWDGNELLCSGQQQQYTINRFASTMEQCESTEVYSLLQKACSSNDTATQQKVYSELSCLEVKPQFYLSLASIGCSPTAEPKCRQMALLTLKSALKRNQLQVELSEEEMGYIRGCVMRPEGCSGQGLGNAQKSLIALLAIWEKRLDFGMLGYLLKLSQSQVMDDRMWALQTLSVIFEDMRFETENIACFQNPQFLEFVQMYIGVFMGNMNINNVRLIEKSLGCMNLLVKYMINIHMKPSPLATYLTNYLLPVLESQSYGERVNEIALDGITEIAEVNSSVIFLNDAALRSIVNLQSEKRAVMRNWLGLLLDLVDTDGEEEKMRGYLAVLMPKIVMNLGFNKEDELHWKMEMEEECNPYSSQEEEDDDCLQEEGGDERITECGYTNRKLAVLLLERLIVQYPSDVWPLCEKTINEVLQSPDPLQRQNGILMVGLIFGKMEEHLEFLQVVLPQIMSQINDVSLPNLLRCTCLWTIGKISYLITRNDVLNREVQATLIRCLQNSNGQVSNTVYSTLEEIIRCSEELPEGFQSIVGCMTRGIRSCLGRPLYSILKTCQTLYERHSTKIPKEVTRVLVKQLALKWSSNCKTESVMSPILECMTTISSVSGQAVKEFAFLIFEEAFKIVENVNQKAIAIRAIDLISSVIGTGDGRIVEILENSEGLHNRLHCLIVSEEKEIRNFSYGLLGDICKVVAIPKFAEWHVQTIGKSINESSSLTLLSNALTCLSDLICSNPALAAQYSPVVMAEAVKWLKTKNMVEEYTHHFARIYGRLGYFSPAEGSLYLRETLRLVCQGLRAREQSKRTDEAYRGIFKMVLYAPMEAVGSFEYLVESFVCYPCGDKEVSQMFVTLLKSFKQSLSQTEWNLFLHKRIFLQAVAKRIEALSS